MRWREFAVTPLPFGALTDREARTKTAVLLRDLSLPLSGAASPTLPATETSTLGPGQRGDFATHLDNNYLRRAAQSRNIKTASRARRTEQRRAAMMGGIRGHRSVPRYKHVARRPRRHFELTLSALVFGNIYVGKNKMVES